MFLVAFVVAVAAEVVAFVLVADQIGVLAAIGLLLLVSLVGGLLVKAQGVRVLREARRELRNDRLPTRQALDGLFLLLAGALLLFPGFVSGAAGLLLLVPPIRSGVRGAATRRWRRRVRSGLGWVTLVRTPFGFRSRDVGGPVVDADAWEDANVAGRQSHARRSLPAPPRPEGQSGAA
jgi:UPF0716 protein FxsA